MKIDECSDTRDNFNPFSPSSTTMPLTIQQVKKMRPINPLRIKGEDQEEVIVPGDWCVTSSHLCFTLFVTHIAFVVFSSPIKVSTSTTDPKLGENIGKQRWNLSTVRAKIKAC
jgi:hypothetical protein